MSIGSIAPTPPVQSTVVSPTTNQARNSASSAGSGSPTTITSTVTQTNADGSITTITTYGDGSTVTTTAPASKTAAVPNGGLLDSKNLGQNAALLSAQAENTTGSAATPA